MRHCSNAVSQTRLTAADLDEQLTELADSAIRLGMTTLAHELREVRGAINGMAARFAAAVNEDLRDMGAENAAHFDRVVETILSRPA